MHSLTDDMLVSWFIANVDSILGFWLLVDVDHIAEVVDTGD
jgi:hypothetical protein